MCASFWLCACNDLSAHKIICFMLLLHCLNMMCVCLLSCFMLDIAFYAYSLQLFQELKISKQNEWKKLTTTIKNQIFDNGILPCISIFYNTYAFVWIFIAWHEILAQIWVSGMCSPISNVQRSQKKSRDACNDFHLLYNCVSISVKFNRQLWFIESLMCVKNEHKIYS